MASVHHARDELLGRDVAVKLFRTGSIEPEDDARQQTEGRILAGLSHRNLVTVFDIGTDTVDFHRRTYLVMELIQGEDLHRTMAHAPLTQDETRVMGRGVAQALAYIHSRGVVHRDVKPANILVGRSGSPDRADKPKLTDFGIARLVEDAHLTVTGQSVGTAAYFSPEQAEGLSVTAASDIYSLGLVLIESLTGKTAFPGPAAASAAARLYRDPPIPPPLNSEWSLLLRAMTSRDPAARPSAEEVSAALDSSFPDAGREVGHPRDATREAAPGIPTAATGTVTPGDDGDPTSPVFTASVAAEPHRDTATRVQVPALQDQQPITAQQPLAGWLPAALYPPGGEGRTGGGDSGLGEAGAAVPARSRGRRRPAVLLSALIALAAALTLVIAAVILVPALMSRAESDPVNYPTSPGELGELLEDLQESVAP